MPQNNRIDALVYPHDPGAGTDQVPLSFKGVNYISFVSSPGGQGEGTYGIPAKLSESHVRDEGLPVTVLYVNPANIAAMVATRTS